MKLISLKAVFKKRKNILLASLFLEIIVLASIVALKHFTAADMAVSATNSVVGSAKAKLSIDIHEDGVLFNLSPQQGSFTEGSEAKLTLSTAAGPYFVTEPLSPNGLSLDVPYIRAGLTPYILTVGQQKFSGNLKRVAGPAITPLEPKLTARAARVDLEQSTAVIIRPLDKHGNVTQSPVNVRVINPDESLLSTELAVEHLLSWTYLPKSRMAGTQYIIAETQTAKGERAELDLLAGEVARSDFAAPIQTAPASARDAWHVRLDFPRDRFVNRISEGTTVLFYGGNEDVDFFVLRPLNQGESNLVLPTYPLIGDYALQTQSGTYKSDPIILEASSVASLDIPIIWNTEEGLSLAIGPIIDAFGAIPDTGSELQLVILDAQKQALTRFTTPLEDGSARISFPPLPEQASTVQVRIAGQLKSISIPKQAPNLEQGIH